ncbi:hypothetical protein CCHOA_04950 [Corynebacterium choanae]|uniref:Uncharacterized protein n=1 Tax=Corynebacterium choanae TaxID=1862358 RepID=A0A3G6J939_9CORY|nr:hypothetical protein CCHOA_04950 [Corynebacterium choanae]
MSRVRVWFVGVAGYMDTCATGDRVETVCTALDVAGKFSVSVHRYKAASNMAEAKVLAR